MNYRGCPNGQPLFFDKCFMKILYYENLIAAQILKLPKIFFVKYT